MKQFAIISQHDDDRDYVDTKLRLEDVADDMEKAIVLGKIIFGNITIHEYNASAYFNFSPNTWTSDCYIRGLRWKVYVQEMEDTELNAFKLAHPEPSQAIQAMQVRLANRA